MPKKLTAKQLMDRSVSERDLQGQIIDMAQRYGWLVAHFRPALTQKGRWLTAVAADGTGFPDLVLVRGKRVLFAELKRETGKLTDQQKVWMDRLSFSGLVEAYIWRPSDMTIVEELLRQ